MRRDRTTTIFRVEKVNNYTPVHRWPAEDERLTWEARGLHMFLLVKPDDWIVSLSHLVKSSPAGRDKIRRIIKELIQYNYIAKKQSRGEQGQFLASEYIVYELPYDGYFDSVMIGSKQPKTGNAATVKPIPDLPPPVDRPLLSKQTKPKIQLTNKTTTEEFIWSPKLASEHQRSIMALIAQIAHEPAQLLIDELSGQIGNINNPVGYFRTLLKSYIAGSFIPSQAVQVKAERDARGKNDREVALSNQLADDKMKRRMKEQGIIK